METTSTPVTTDTQAIIEQNIERRKSGQSDIQRFTRAQKKQAQTEARLAPTIAELAGQDGQPIEREGLLFYPRSPKMRDLDAITASLNDIQISGMSLSESVMRMACFILVIEGADGKRRLATFDEIADSFNVSDMELLAELVGKYLNLKLTAETSEAKNE